VKEGREGGREGGRRRRRRRRRRGLKMRWSERVYESIGDKMYQQKLLAM
jgi:hypothetical protein